MKFNSNLQNTTKNDRIDAGILVDKHGNIENKEENLEKKNEKDLDLLIGELYLYTIIITCTNWKI